MSSFDAEAVRPRAGSLARSSSSTSSTPARQHHLQQQQQQHHNLHTSSNNSTPSPGETRRYQYVPYSASSQPTPEYGSQTSVPGQPSSRTGRSQYVGFTSQGIAVQRLNRGNMPGSRSPQRSPPTRRSPHNGWQVMDQRQHAALNSSSHYHGSREEQRQGYSIAERQARSSSLKSGTRSMVDHFAEFSDPHQQFNNHISSHQHRASSSSSENSPQGSPLHRSPRGDTTNQILARTGHQNSPANYSRYQHQQYARQIQQQAALAVQEDLNEMQPRKSRHSSNSSKRHNSTDALESPYRSASRHTFAATSNNVPRRVSSSDSFSFASSIKCCVGIQPKKKKSSRRAVAYYPPQQQKHKERLNNDTSDNWVSLSAVRSQYPPHAAYRNSPSQSTVSCPYIVQAPPTRSNGHASKHSSGYVSEMETSPSTLNFESESDMSDSEFARTAGSRGKSANSMMMKLAKKLSKKSLPITNNDGDGSSIGGDSLGKGEGKALKSKHRSSSVSNLDSIGG